MHCGSSCVLVERAASNSRLDLTKACLARRCILPPLRRRFEPRRWRWPSQLKRHPLDRSEIAMTGESEPLIFTPEFISSLNDSGAAFERHEIARLAKARRAGPFRLRLEDAARAWPTDKRGPLIGRIQSLSPTESWSAVSELLVHELLLKEFADVQVEPPLPELGGKTPDFVVRSCDMAVEVATVFEQTDVQAQIIIETINGITSGTKIMNLTIRGTTGTSNPRLSEIRQEVGKILASYNAASALQAFQFVASDGVSLSGLLYKGCPEHPTVGGVLGQYVADSGEPGYNAAIRKNVLASKSKKYRSLAHSANMRLVVALYCRNDWLDEIDFAEILFGDEEFLVDQGGVCRMVRRNPFFRADRNRSVSAVLVRSAPLDPKWILVNNPFACVSLGTVQARLERAFSAHIVNSAKELTSCVP